MAKVKQGVAAIFLLTVFFARAQYPVLYKVVDKDSIALKTLSLQKTFASHPEAKTYLVRLPFLLQSKGFITASVDSLQIDSTKAVALLFLGEQYKWANIHTDPKDENILVAARWPSAFSGLIDFKELNRRQQNILDYLEENGHPFGKTFLDSITIRGNEVEAILRIDQGPLYTIDSIRVYGDVKLNNEFLQKYLGITNGSAYNVAKLKRISKKLSELNFLQEDRPADVTRLATGSVLNLYLKSKKTNQVNALIGFLPNSGLQVKKKLLLTVDANILLRNALGSSETFGLLWQQLQQSSPKINMMYDQPYVFKTAFGMSFSFDMFKQDSSFLNLNLKLGGNYNLGNNQSATLFLMRRQTIVNSINTANIIQTKRLPKEGDVSSLNLGFSYDQNSTDYRFNPRKGIIVSITSSGGTKKIKKNSQVLELRDPANPAFKFEKLYDSVKQSAYQFRLNASGAKYFPVGRQSTVKLALNAGIYQSANYFRNELFQIGGYKLMRGFNEESQYVSQYSIASTEFRYLIGLNSAFFVFADGGWGNHLLEEKNSHTYLGTGAGLSFETKAGLINLAWALGKRDDTEWNLRQSKIHIGFAGYF